jgi:threonine synthase
MVNPVELRCVLCGASYAPGEVEYTCPKCGLDGTLDVLYDYEEAARTLTSGALSGRASSLWRYGEILPVEAEENIPSLSVGGLPITTVQPLPRSTGSGSFS